MAAGNVQLQELVDRAVPPGGTVNCEALHKLLHVIVCNLVNPAPIKTDFKCTVTAVGTKPSGAAVAQKEDNISEMVKDLKNMVETQRKLISELHLKVQSLEKASTGRGRSRSRSRSRSRPTSRNASKKSLTSARSRSVIKPSTSSGQWTTFHHPGKGPSVGKPKQRSAMNVRPKQGSSKSVDIPIPELKKWVDQKLRDLEQVDDNLLERINKLVKDTMKSTVVPDMQKMIESMLVSSYKAQKSAQSAGTTLPLCLSCQNAAAAAAAAATNANQVSSQDCMCVVKRKLRNASSKMNVKKK
ncbi:hypothetical protein RP20_CCG017949 [Aedes albopictus]|nr:hypothetical protein RP20_CCG017949 [Aedes albopictus]